MITYDDATNIKSGAQELRLVETVKSDVLAPTETIIPFVDEDINDLDNATEAWWATGDHIIAAHLLDDVDDNVKDLLPFGTEILSITPHGSSQWSRTAEIHTEINHEAISYFIKVTDRPSGREMYNCEFESLLVINKAIPQHSPRPIGWGHYRSDPDTWFLLTSFIDMHDDDPDPEFLPRALSQLHQKARALDGRYGFHVTVSSGGLPVKLAQSKSWEDFFFRYMRYMVRAEQIAAGPRTPEMDRLLKHLFNRIIPRLLRPLETGGREIAPVLLHTDLWAGNAGIDSEGLPIIFDPCSFYGHHEFDLGVWSMGRGIITRSFIDNYTNINGISRPEEDFDARNLLYLLAFEVRVSATITGDPMFRRVVLECLTTLDKMVPESYEEWATARGEKVYPSKVNRGLQWP